MLSVLQNFAVNSIAFGATASLSLERIWGTENRPTLERIKAYPGRAVEEVKNVLSKGKTAQSIVTGMKTLKDLGTLATLRLPERDLCMNLVAGDLNPNVGFHHATSDTLQLMRAPVAAFNTKTKRILLCSSKLPILSALAIPKTIFNGLLTVAGIVVESSLTPMEHVGIVIDGGGISNPGTKFKIGEPYSQEKYIQGKNCVEVVPEGNQSASRTIELLHCGAANLNLQGDTAKYDMFSNNCQAQSRDLLHVANCPANIFSNFGIGDQLTSSEAKQAREKNVQELKLRCEDKLAQSLQLFKELLVQVDSDSVESEGPISNEALKSLEEFLKDGVEAHSADFYLQLFLLVSQLPGIGGEVHPLKIFIKENLPEEKMELIFQKILANFFVVPPPVEMDEHFREFFALFPVETVQAEEVKNYKQRENTWSDFERILDPVPVKSPSDMIWSGFNTPTAEKLKMSLKHFLGKSSL